MNTKNVKTTIKTNLREKTKLKLYSEQYLVRGRDRDPH